MKIQVVVGGQYGSEAKGAVAGYLAHDAEHPTCIRVAGPNAGHSVVNPATGVKHALRTIPVGAVTNPDALLCIAAGSEVDLAVLAAEVQMLENDGISVRHRLYIDPAATILTGEHAAEESSAELVARIGSTGKGIGAARAARIMRTAQTIGQLTGNTGMVKSGDWLVGYVARVAPLALSRGRDIQIEGTQGYGLSLHHRNYPQVTSSDCTALDFLAMARIAPWIVTRSQLEIWIVYRPYPIRVAGNSGPLHGETTWEELGLEPELTTVTKKVRRVGTWDDELAQDAAAANHWGEAYLPGELHRHIDFDRSPLRYAITMADQIDPKLAGATTRTALLDSTPFQQFLHHFKDTMGQGPDMVTTSDRTHIRLRWGREAGAW